MADMDAQDTSIVLHPGEFTTGERAMGEIWRFYKPVVLRIPHCFMEAAHRAHTFVFIAGLVVLVAGWGFSTWCLEWGGLAIVIAAFVSNFLVSAYEHHRELLEWRTARLFWGYANGGGFSHADESNWDEIKADGTRINRFLEVSNTKDYTELFDRGRKLAIRLYADRSELKNYGGDFAYYHDGKWITPENPTAKKNPNEDLLKIRLQESPESLPRPSRKGSGDGNGRNFCEKRESACTNSPIGSGDSTRWPGPKSAVGERGSPCHESSSWDDFSATVVKMLSNTLFGHYQADSPKMTFSCYGTVRPTLAPCCPRKSSNLRVTNARNSGHPL